MILSPGPKLSLEAFYDIGVKRGDMVFMGIEWLITSMATDPLAKNAIKRQELMLDPI